MHPAFLALAKNRFKFCLFLLQKLPAAYFSGVRLKLVNATRAEVTLPYGWFTRNPFRSTYFACLAMAAEMSTGVLAMGYCWEKKPAIRMLVKNVEATFLKKATGQTIFICQEGPAIQQAIQDAQTTGESVSCRIRSTGYNQQQEIVAEFYITWSFKLKSNN